MNGQPITSQTWAAIRAEFTLPSLGLVRRRLSELMEDPQPVLRLLVRVFLSGLGNLDSSSSPAATSTRQSWGSSGEPWS
ncbi:hypothetical protein RCH07_002648 [Arthrobacter sp. CG_A4]|nr:hypothetical protein [Arthrobacter sp. CG_A4]